MLVLRRKLNEEIVITGNIRIKIVEIERTGVKLAIVAPDNVVIDRLEVHERKEQDKQNQSPQPVETPPQPALS